MKKLLVYLLLTTCYFLSSTLAWAQTKDVPEKHWAAKAVSEAIKMGMIKGYPDGTFRGQKNITRYETAAMMARLSEYLENQISISGEVLAQDVRLVWKEIPTKEAKPLPVFNHSLETRLRAANLISSGMATAGLGRLGPKVDYRLRLSFPHQLNKDVFLKINLDTMDAGFGGVENLATKLLDAEGKIKFFIKELPVELKATVGPGTISHLDQEIVFSENYMIYIRPKNTVTLSTVIDKIELSAAYISRNINLSEIGTSEITGTVAQRFDKIKISGTGSFLFTKEFLRSSGEKDWRGKIDLLYEPNGKITAEATLGIGTFQNFPHGLYLALGLKLNDPLASGTDLKFKVHKVGTEYRLAFDKYEFVPLNFFDKLILDGTVDLGAEINQRINPKLTLTGKGDLVLTGGYKYGAAYPGTSFILEGEVAYNPALNTTYFLSYRLYHVPSEIDSLGTVVPKISDVLTFGGRYKF